ncbi:DUF1996 domain-containing protein [Shewanella cyperi]|uniref:DUF1996 domain-containing protein n=2 Tax=Shewanella cyperi TaxID=2814292 RepID=A0A974XP54_9GAMM|nr:DUF1996 domain-containing protein [Shewanella cyperi]
MMNKSLFVFISVLTLTLTGCGSSEDNPPSLDSVSPAAPTFKLKPESVTQEAFATFEFVADDAVNFECQLDGGHVTDCSSPLFLYPLSPQEHQLSVWSLDINGKRSEVAIAQWRVSSVFSGGSGTGVHADLVATEVQPTLAAEDSWRGIFRINCDFAHAGYNDPIVFPGQANAGHLHRFYGNTLVDENTDTTSLLTSGESSCQGNELNRSSYWIPALLAPSYDLQTGERMLDAQGEPAWHVVPAVVGNDEETHEIFYYSAGVDDLESIQTIPLGLKMIAGNHMAQPGNEQDSAVVRWHCQSWESTDAGNPRWSTGIPECREPDRLRMDIFFPSCWNGVDLDSYDHKSHLAYPINTGGPQGSVCPASHPVPIIRVSFHYAFGVKPEVSDPETNSSRGWRLASDRYEVTPFTPGGMSLHGDWFNAWHPEVLETVLKECIQQRLDCHDGNLANGFRLSGTRPGTQSEAAVINMGLGY